MYAFHVSRKGLASPPGERSRNEPVPWRQPARDRRRHEPGTGSGGDQQGPESKHDQLIGLYFNAGRQRAYSLGRLQRPW